MCYFLGVEHSFVQSLIKTNVFSRKVKKQFLAIRIPPEKLENVFFELFQQSGGALRP